MNSLYASLDAIVGQVRDSLDEEDADDFPHESWVRGHEHAASALREVTAAVLRRRPAILEMLTECVEPRYPESSPLYP